MAEVRLCPACRKARLSRYNHDPLCAPCMRASRVAPALAEPVTLAWLWDSGPMRDALARVDLAAVVAVLRAAAGLSQHELADIIGWSQSSLSLFESGQRDTLYDVRALFRFADAVDMPREALLPLLLGQASAVLPDDLAAVLPLAAGDGLEDVSVDVERRRFGGMMTGAVTAVMLPAVTVPAKVTPSHVRYLKTCVDSLVSRDQAVGGGALLRQAVRQWQRARRMLDESDYSETVGRDLLGVTGNLAISAGWLAFDAADLPLARRMYAQALFLAGSADDPVLTAHVLEKSAMLSCFAARSAGARGLAREGLRLADQAAVAAAREPTARLRALIALRRASATSLLGDEHGFRASINCARAELDRGVSADDPAWIRFVDESEVSSQQALGLTNLGHHRAAVELHRKGLEVPQAAIRNSACAHAQLAAALVADGDVNSAVSEAKSVLPMFAGGVTSKRAFNELRPVRLAAQVRDEEFCVRFDSVERELTV